MKIDVLDLEQKMERKQTTTTGKYAVHTDIELFSANNFCGRKSRNLNKITFQNDYLQRVS